MRILLVALNAHYMHTSLAVRLLKASVPAESGFEIAVQESHINQPFDRVLRDLAMTRSEAYGFSCYIWNISYVLRLCRALKRARPEACVFLGGPEAACRAEELLAREPSVDYILHGEGETVFPAFLDALRAGNASGAPGLFFRNGAGEICRTPAPGLLAPEKWPDVYRDGIDGLENRLLYIETSRGCPYSCQYCLSSGDRVRALDAKEAARRLIFLADHGAKIIKLVDRTFNYDRQRARTIWSALIDHALETGLRPVYHCEIAANLIGDEDIELLSRAPEGLFQFEVGVQSSNERVLETVKRGVPFEDVRRAALRLAALRGVCLHVDLIAGLPGENMASFARSFNETFALGADQLQLGFLKLLHGSGLRADADRLGIVFEPDAPYEVLSTADMSFDELCFLKDVERVLDYYANSGRYPQTVRFLIRGKTPFDVFALLAKTMRERGFFAGELGEKARAAALLECAVWADRSFLSALVRHDMLSQGRRRDLPDDLAFAESGADRALLRARFHPVRGQSIFRYDVDLRAWLEEGAVRKTPCAVLYDAQGRAEWL